MVALEAKILAQLNERAPGYDVTPLRDKLVAAIHNTGRTKKDVLAQVTALLTEGTEVMRSHADESEAAKQFVRRYYAVITGLREGVLSEGQAVPADLKSAMTGAMADAMSDPAIAEQSPFDLGVFDFIRRVSKAMKARGDLA
jgi:hypothetical protein